MTVVCLGEALIDLNSPAHQSLLEADQLAVHVGGAPLNVAIHLKRAGIPSYFLGTLSNDGFGDRIRSLLDREGVEFGPEAPVDAATRLAVIDHQDTKPPFTFYGDRPADTRLRLADVRRIIAPGIKALYVSSLMMADRSAARVQVVAVRDALELGNIIVVSDPNPRPAAWKTQTAMTEATEWLLQHSQLVKISLDDADALGWPTDPSGLMSKVKSLTPGFTVITNGAQGSWFESNDELHHVPAPDIDLADPTGAGDAFFAAVIAGALKERQISLEILRDASSAGAAMAARAGTL